MPKHAIVSIVSVVGALLLIVAVALAVVRPWESPEQRASTPLVDASTHVLDDAGDGAPVVVEFFDYECPSCGRFHPIVEELRDRYDGRVTFAVRHFPLPIHPSAVPAALAAEAAAQQGAFEPMHALLLERQQEWSGIEGAAATFRGYAEELALDLDAFDAAVADPATLARIQQDADAGAALGVQSTPTFFVDGERVDLRDFGDVETAIEAALAG